jgi:5-methylcytosine-specific restriction endonuclease McrA
MRTVITTDGNGQFGYPITFLEKEDIEKLEKKETKENKKWPSKADIWDKTDGICWYCGTKLNPFKNFSIDHIIPKIQKIENLVPCCKRCNSQKNNKSIEHLRETKTKEAPRNIYKFWFEKRG